MRWIFETPRLTARKMSLADLDFVASLYGDPEVMRYYPRCSSRDECRDAIIRQSEHYELHGYGRWLMEDRASRRAVGLVGLIHQRIEEFEGPEADWMIDRGWWRQGIATEAASASCRFAFDTLEAPVVIAMIRPVNLPSTGLARKLGMTPGPTIVHADLDHEVWSMDRDRAIALNLAGPATG